MPRAIPSHDPMWRRLGERDLLTLRCSCRGWEINWTIVDLKERGIDHLATAVIAMLEEHQAHVRRLARRALPPPSFY